ncbi:hypothetical protein BDF14DRAFT_84031 [Spinellus fusiger]|nr:hypothetical protein BDF14DRAFT_84031 [Spinellus fusiger]
MNPANTPPFHQSLCSAEDVSLATDMQGLSASLGGQKRRKIEYAPQNSPFSSFTVSAQSYNLGWVPFEDTRFLGPLTKDRLVWWDVVIPLNKVSAVRTPLLIVLYCSPQALNYVVSHTIESSVALCEPSFVNPSCCYDPRGYLHLMTVGRVKSTSMGGIQHRRLGEPVQR